MISKKESEHNIIRCIEGIKFNDENLDYYINCLIREVEAKEKVEILEMIDELDTNICSACKNIIKQKIERK